ncbi:MAG: hypothetical protein WA994_07650, partial [Ornithinimicrobium sp.]
MDYLVQMLRYQGAGPPVASAVPRPLQERRRVDARVADGFEQAMIGSRQRIGSSRRAVEKAVERRRQSRTLGGG